MLQTLFHYQFPLNYVMWQPTFSRLYPFLPDCSSSHPYVPVFPSVYQVQQQYMQCLSFQQRLPFYYCSTNQPQPIFSHFQPHTWNQVTNTYPPVTRNDYHWSALRNPTTHTFIGTQIDLQSPKNAAFQDKIPRVLESISDDEEDDSIETNDSELDYYESDTSHYDDSESDFYDSNATSPAPHYSETQSLDFSQSYMTDIVYPSLPINCTSVWEMQETIEAPTRIWDSFKVYRSKYLFRKLDDLCCVKGIGNTIKLRFKRMFVYDDYDYSVSDDPYISLPPHVQRIVGSDQECKTLNMHKVKDIKSADRLLILHVNVRSLEKNFANFEYLIDCTCPHVVCVTETNNPDPAEVQLSGYNCEFTHSTKKGRGCQGGVMIYVQNNLNYKLIGEGFKLANSETAWIELESHGSESLHIIIGVVYRHPKQKKSAITTFQRNLNSLLSSNAFQEQAVYVLGDINIDLLQHSHKFIEYCEKLADQKFKLLITKPTRVKNQSSTLIDHIYARDSKSAESGIVTFDKENTSSFSCDFDHFPIYCNLPIGMAVSSKYNQSNCHLGSTSLFPKIWNPFTLYRYSY